MASLNKALNQMISDQTRSDKLEHHRCDICSHLPDMSAPAALCWQSLVEYSWTRCRNTVACVPEVAYFLKLFVRSGFVCQHTSRRQTGRTSAPAVSFALVFFCFKLAV